MTRKRVDSYDGDPLTPFDHERAIRSRLKAAIAFGPKFKRITQREVEERSERGGRRGVKQQTLNEFLQGRTTRLRSSAIRDLAHALEVPVKWLRGDLDGLPHVHWRLEADSQSEPYDEPPIYHLAQYRFITKCLKAFRRDLTEANGKDGRALYQEWKDPFASGFHALIWVQDPRDGLYLQYGQGRSEMTRDEFDDAIVARVRYWEVTLKPWMKGKLILDYLGLLEHMGGVIGESVIVDLRLPFTPRG